MRATCVTMQVTAPSTPFAAVVVRALHDGVLQLYELYQPLVVALVQQIDSHGWCGHVIGAADVEPL